MFGWRFATTLCNNTSTGSNRKASSASAKKRLNVATEILKTGPSRESSKRALFQSPGKELPHPNRYS
ncbi:hypothetical protein EVAR_101357_1 [Eumeta japonica]|uniref:Uncharacterized protein n=1 Tax=Eumeta variegata TaxID=151549 RepID=A0A4C1TBS1_EUMVA|nr:hypothetical protein EVAR_101357_1 [Eumeta japonica]